MAYAVAVGSRRRGGIEEEVGKSVTCHIVMCLVCHADYIGHYLLRNGDLGKAPHTIRLEM